MKRLKSKNGPKALGSYSIATQVNMFIYTSGQLGIDPQTNVLSKKDIVQQTSQAMKNVQSILENNNSSMENIVKTTVYLADINDFNTFDATYSEFFSNENFPSRTVIQVASLPKDAEIEIEAIALTNE